VLIETIRTYQEEAQSTRLFEIEGLRYRAPSWLHALDMYERETSKRPPRQAVVEVIPHAI
jgi:hypothetical protein